MIKTQLENVGSTTLKIKNKLLQSLREIRRAAFLSRLYMYMFKGEPKAGMEFYVLLCSDDKFCAELGRAILAAGRLESALKEYINRHAPEVDTIRATLGRLIVFARKYSLLSKMLPVLELLRDQRNYLTHNIHALFSGLIEETILESIDLLDSDVVTYTERAWQLKENLNSIADIVETYIHNH